MSISSSKASRSASASRAFLQTSILLRLAQSPSCLYHTYMPFLAEKMMKAWVFERALYPSRKPLVGSTVWISFCLFLLFLLRLRRFLGWRCRGLFGRFGVLRFSFLAILAPCNPLIFKSQTNLCLGVK
jgi:hypothetical protein